MLKSVQRCPTLKIYGLNQTYLHPPYTVVPIYVDLLPAVVYLHTYIYIYIHTYMYMYSTVYICPKTLFFPTSPFGHDIPPVWWLFKISFYLHIFFLFPRAFSVFSPHKWHQLISSLQVKIHRSNVLQLVIGVAWIHIGEDRKGSNPDRKRTYQPLFQDLHSGPFISVHCLYVDILREKTGKTL